MDKVYGRRIGAGLPDSFHWIIPGKLAGAETPTLAHLKTYSKMGFNTLICLQTGLFNDSPFYEEKDLVKHGLEVKYIPVGDFNPPRTQDFDKFIRFVEEPGRIVLVHCWAGKGRTGSMLAVYLGVKEKLKGEEAVDKIREIWWEYIQTEEQEGSVKNYLALQE